MINISTMHAPEQEQAQTKRKVVMIGVAVPTELFERLRQVCFDNRLTKQEIALTGLESAIQDLESIAYED